ncbi:MAG: hypothetical protein ACI4JA_07955 [Oscillospiraceae bacterium]
MKDKKENCVELNIFVECDKCQKPEPKEPCEAADKKDEDESCVKINVFVDCGKKKCRYTSDGKSGQNSIAYQKANGNCFQNRNSSRF